MLATGSPLPQIAAVDTDGRPFPLGGERAAPLVLYFMRTASCHICNRHARDLAAQRDTLGEQGVDLAIVLTEAVDEARAWQQQRGIAVPALTSASGTTIHAQLGLDRKVMSTMQQSGTVLVDRAGTVRYSRRATSPTGAYDRTELTQAIAALTSDAPAAAEATRVVV